MLPPPGGEPDAGIKEAGEGGSEGRALDAKFEKLGDGRANALPPLAPPALVEESEVEGNEGKAGYGKA